MGVYHLSRSFWPLFRMLLLLLLNCKKGDPRTPVDDEFATDSSDEILCRLSILEIVVGNLTEELLLSGLPTPVADPSDNEETTSRIDTPGEIRTC